MKYINPWYAVIFAVCTMSLWGCSQQRSAAINAKINELESRYTKLEEDYRTVQLSNEQQRKRLAHIEAQKTALEAQKTALEVERTALNRQVGTLNTERESLWKQIKIRTAERDTANNNLVQFSKELQAFTVRVESALNTNTPLSGATIVPVSRRTD